VSRYRDEIVLRKRGADRETLTLNAFLRHPLVTAGMVSAYCAERLRRVKPGTLNRELDILRHAFATARRDWDVPLASNAFASVTRPKSGPPRERRLRSGEQERLLSACGRAATRTSACSSGALATLRTLGDGGSSGEERILPITHDAAKMGWKKIGEEGGAGGPEVSRSTTRGDQQAFEKGLSVPEVALISGHRDPRMLFRYTHPRAEDIAVKLQ
jgi:hypothetical protein